MSVDHTGPGGSKASINAPRASAGPKPPPRPVRADERRATPAGFASTVTEVPPVADDRTGEILLDERAPAVVTEADLAPPRIEPVAAAPDTASATRRGRRARRGRRVKRVVRRIDLWSVLKLSLVVYTCIYLSALATIAALWGLLYSSGTIENLQDFLADVGLENFTFYGNQMFRACAAVGAVGVMAGTVITVLATALVNVISEMTGGIRLVVIEEDPDR